MNALATLNFSLLVFAMALVLLMGARKIYAIITANAKSRASEDDSEDDGDEPIQVAIPKRRIKLSARQFIPLDFLYRRPRRRPPDTPPPPQ